MIILFAILMSIIIFICFIGFIVESDKDLRDKLLTILILCIILLSIITYLSTVT